MLTCVGFLNIIYDIKYKMPNGLLQVDDLKDISENNLCKCHLHIFQELNKSYVVILFTKLRDMFLKTFGFTAFRQMQIEMLKYNTSQCNVKSKHHEVHIAENALQGLRGSHCEIAGVGLVQESKGRRV